MNTPFLRDATDFTDIPVKEHPGAKYADMKEYTVCPRCHGHGGWNLKLNRYRPIEGRPGSQHFQASCSQCWGWGYVPEADATCLHDYKEIAPDQPWRCWHTIQCTKCGRTRSYDSSD